MWRVLSLSRYRSRRAPQRKRLAVFIPLRSDSCFIFSAQIRPTPVLSEALCHIELAARSTFPPAVQPMGSNCRSHTDSVGVSKARATGNSGLPCRIHDSFGIARTSGSQIPAVQRGDRGARRETRAGSNLDLLFAITVERGRIGRPFISKALIPTHAGTRVTVFLFFW